jgi:hypothetical protein
MLVSKIKPCMFECLMIMFRLRMAHYKCSDGVFIVL